jgi:RNA polymerase primary sigma factor
VTKSYDDSFEKLNRSGIEIGIENHEQSKLNNERSELNHELLNESNRRAKTRQPKNKIRLSTDYNTISEQYLKSLRRYPILKKEEEYDLVFRAQNGDKEARDLMIKSNLGLVINVAKRFVGRGLSFEDIVEEGNLGLMKAVDKFQPKKGFRFSTYAMWWIRQSIERGILNSGRLIRLPIHVSENLFKFSRAVKELKKNNEREPILKEIANHIGMDEDKVEKILTSISNIYPIDLPISQGEEEQNLTLSNIIKEDEEKTSPYEILTNIETLELLNKWLLSLHDNERKIIILRYGLNHEKSKTLNEIGLIFNLTKERIRQIEVKSISKLKKMAEESGHLK